MKGTDQELQVDEFTAQRFIDQGEAVAIKTPPPKMADAPSWVPPIPSPVRVQIPIEVQKITQDLGLSNQPQSYAFIRRFLELEARGTRLADAVKDLIQDAALVRHL